MFRDQSERSKWSREQAQNLILHIFSHNYHNYSMFRDVRGCSGMFRDVPCSGFYRRPKSCAWRIFESSSVFYKSEDLSSIAVVLLFIGESLSLNPKGWMLRQELYNIAEAKRRLMNGKLECWFVFFHWNMGVFNERYDVKGKETVLYSNVNFQMVNIIFKAKTWMLSAQLDFRRGCNAIWNRPHLQN